MMNMTANSETVNHNTENIKLGLNVFLWTILSAILNFIILLSLTTIATGLSTKTIGERIVEISDDGKRTVLTEIYYDKTTTSSTDKTTAIQSSSASSNSSSTEITASSSSNGGTSSSSSSNTNKSGNTTVAGDKTTQTGTTLPENQRREGIRTEMTAGASLALDIISQLFMLILFVSMAYSKVWERGDKDRNSVQFGRMSEDKSRGIQVGLYAAIPSVIFYIVLVLSKLGFVSDGYYFFYRFLNITFIPFINRVVGTGIFKTSKVSWLSLLGILMTLIILPLICHIAYLLGYKQISLSEKFIYKDSKKRKKLRKF
ncbi:MAG: hypothetical protein PHH84_02260 [Oscillospiraceae bacterium]|nr:hypothetical protein [Oscillospiraceae bacterium]